MSDFKTMAERIREELSKGSYQMPCDTLPYETQAAAIAAALSAAGIGLVADANFQATDLIRDLIDPEDCSFDHHGGFQAHGYLDLQIGDLCPQLEAKAWVRNQDAAAVRGEG